jgi:hypothetical protein
MDTESSGSSGPRGRSPRIVGADAQTTEKVTLRCRFVVGLGDRTVVFSRWIKRAGEADTAQTPTAGAAQATSAHCGTCVLFVLGRRRPGTDTVIAVRTPYIALAEGYNEDGTGA